MTLCAQLCVSELSCAHQRYHIIHNNITLYLRPNENPPPRPASALHTHTTYPRINYVRLQYIIYIFGVHALSQIRKPPKVVILAGESHVTGARWLIDTRPPPNLYAGVLNISYALCGHIRVRVQIDNHSKLNPAMTFVYRRTVTTRKSIYDHIIFILIYFIYNQRGQYRLNIIL